MLQYELYGFQSDLTSKLSVVDDKPLESRLIGDDMGLGKTLEASEIDKILRAHAGRPRTHKTLIVAPHGTHGSWKRHIEMVMPGAKVIVIDRKDRSAFVRCLKNPTYTHYVMHYEALRLIPELRDVNWFHIIADEVHRIKNRKAQQTRKLKEQSTQFKTGCSGTPADNAPQDLWSINNWLYPKKYRSYWSFVKRFCLEEVTENKFGGTFRKIVGTNPITIGQLHEEMSGWYMRRLKKDVLKDLPEKYYTERYVDLLPAQRKVYNQMRKNMIAWIGEHEDTPLVASVVVAQLVRLQQIALATPEWYLWKTDPESGEPINRIKLVEPSSKLDDLQEIVDDNPTEQLVVFTQSRSMVNLVAARFGSKSRRVGRYSGDVSAANRNLVVEGFQRGDIDIFAGTIAAGGEGIELTAASTCVFLDRHWSPSKNNQAEDRLHRIGQPNAVQIIDIMARDTVDLGRRAVIASKWENLKLLLGDKVDPQAYRLAVEMTKQPSLVQHAMMDALQTFGR